MFQTARLKLTLYYLVIITVISIIFSGTLFHFMANEIDRIERIDFHHVEHGDFFDPQAAHPSIIFDPTVYGQAKNRIIFILVIINVIIVSSSGLAGYFLAGRTLSPIKNMVSEQNRFITDASHELRTPLTALRSEIEVYMRGHDHSVKDAHVLLLSNLEEVQNLQALTDNLIQLAQYQKQNGNHVKTTVFLQDIVQDAIKKLQKVAKQKDIQITAQISDCFVSGDRDSLVQLFGIFLDNAIKYSPQKSTIHILTTKTDQTVSIQITDEGIGIAKEDIPHIFDRFYRADLSRTKQQVPGYGLGLSIAKKIITMHHGDVSVKSDSGKGTTFLVKLPIKKQMETV